jgi:hypothetical protein
MQTGVVAYLRNIAARCRKISQNSSDPHIQEAIGEISVDLAEKAEALETTSKIPRGPMPG